jgi:lysine 2,3-aminomutase
MKTSEWFDWHWQAREAIRRPDDLLKRLEAHELVSSSRVRLPENIRNRLAERHAAYDINISLHNLETILGHCAEHCDGDLARSPLWTFLAPTAREDGEGVDWPRQEAVPVKGLMQFYGCTVDLVVTSVCPVNCRMCTRRNVKFAGVSGNDMAAAIERIRSSPEIRQVVLTGGDALMLENDKLFKIIEELKGIEHLASIRVATRALTAMPMRITHDRRFLEGIEKYASQDGPRLFVHTFVAHWAELDEAFEEAVSALRTAGVIVYNSSVLCAGVNDDYDTLDRIIAKLCRCGVINHHLFQCDIGRGLEGFWVPVDRALALFRQLYLTWPHSLGGPRDLMTTIPRNGRITFHPMLQLDSVTEEIDGHRFIKLCADVTGNTVYYPRDNDALRKYMVDPFRYIEHEREILLHDAASEAKWVLPVLRGRP